MRPLSRSVRSLLALGLALALPAPAAAWGFIGHRIVNRKAIETLPPELRPLFAANADYVSEHSIDPDLWRASGTPGEDPNHYLDMDAFGAAPPFPEIPRSEQEHVQRNGEDALEKGRVPWRAAEVYRDLVAAFRARDAAAVLERAAVLGHYVGDAHVPLHAVLNYDGQLTGQRGVHARWESELLERFELQIVARVQPRVETVTQDPVQATFDALVESFPLAAAVLESDKAEAGPADFATTPEDDRYDDGYYSRTFAREGDRVVARLRARRSASGALWRQAWEEAGRPPLPAAFRVPYVRKSSKAVLLSIDGGAAWVLDDAVRRGVMPRLAALRAAGATGRMLPAMPPKTAVGHASLYTGGVERPARHRGQRGAGAGGVPAGGQHRLRLPAPARGADLGDGRPPGAGRVAGQRHPGLSLRALHRRAPLRRQLRAQPGPVRRLPGVERPTRSTTATTCRCGRWAPGWPAARARGRDARGGAAGGGRAARRPALRRPRRSGRRLRHAVPRPGPRPARRHHAQAGAVGRQARAPSRPCASMGGGESGVFFRLWTLAPDGSELQLYRTALQVLRTLPARLEAPALEATGGFVGNGASYPYAAGRWARPSGTAATGPPSAATSRPRASPRASSSASSSSESPARPGTCSWATCPTPTSSSTCGGRARPGRARPRPGLARRLRPFLDEGLRIADGHVAALRRHADANTVLAIGADHGMAAIRTRVRMNAALRDASLLALDDSGRIDLARTPVHYLEASGYFQVNRVGRPFGLVPPEAEGGCDRRHPSHAARPSRSPHGKGPRDRSRHPRKRAGHRGTPGRRPVLPSRTPHVYPEGDLGPEVVRDDVPTGEHLLEPKEPAMHASFVVAGVGVLAGELGVIRQVDVAPTLCALLGIGPPAQSKGRVLTRALARDGEPGRGPEP